jgi:trehalose/maltose transport system permease protein
MNAARAFRWLAAICLAGIISSFVLGPFLWQIITALKPEAQLSQLPPLLPHPPTWQHFSEVLHTPDFLRVFWNSVLVALLVVLAALVLGVPASYGLAKLRLRGGHLLLAAMLVFSMFPPIANVAPLYLLLVRLGIRDSIFGIVLAHSVYALPFTIWLLTSFFREIPDDLYRAAKIDGCSHLGILRHVVLPLAVPGLLSVSLLVFLFSWNEFLYAFTLTATARSRTLPVAIALFPGLHEIPWGEISAAAVLATLPSILLMLIFQRYIVTGLTAGSVKG